jgi:Flp pilus assembly protein TadD
VSCLLSWSTGADGIDKAHTLLAQSNFELAAQFLDRALELEPTNLEARELLGVAHLEAGDPEIGRTVRNAFINSWSQRLMR